MCKIETSAQLESALSAVVEWRTESYRTRSLGKLESAASDLSAFLGADITPKKCKIYNAEADRTGPLHGVFVAFVFLKCAGEMKAGRYLYNRMLHVLATVAGREFGAVSDAFEKSRVVGAETLEKLMSCWHRCILAESSDTSPHIYTKLTKAFLHLALRRCNADDSVCCLANVYLAVICYISRHHQTAINFCKVVITKRNSCCITAENRRIPRVNGRLMSDYDSNIAAVSGLIGLYDYVKRKSMLDNQNTKYYTNFYSAEALARYTVVKCHQLNKVTAATHVRLYEAMQQYRRYVNESSDKLFFSDMLLFRLVMARCPQFRCRPVFRWSDHLGRTGRLKTMIDGYDAHGFSEMLIHLAVENLTKFREFEVRQFGSDCVAVTTDYEALNAYRCQQYDRCLSLSQDIVNDILFMNVMPQVCIDSPQLVLMDDDIASIVGLMHLIGGSQPTMNRLATQLAIALYLEIRCLIKLDHPVPSLIDALLRTQVAYHRHDENEMSLSHWILAFIYRKARLYLSGFTNAAHGVSPESLRHGESMVHARILRQDASLVLQIQTITKTVSYALEPVRLLM